jgi:hypothetical protein
MMDDYVIRIKPLENGFMVEVPDMAAIKAKQAAAKKEAPVPSRGYIGDCTESYAAKSVAEVLKLVKSSLAQLPESEYASAFEEAAKSK